MWKGSDGAAGCEATETRRPCQRGLPGRRARLSFLLVLYPLELLVSVEVENEDGREHKEESDNRRERDAHDVALPNGVMKANWHRRGDISVLWGAGWPTSVHTPHRFG